MLLSSGQVSALISSSIIVLCTVALFASGLVLQRQSVKNLNSVLHPGDNGKGPWEKLVARAELILQEQQHKADEERQARLFELPQAQDVDIKTAREGFVPEVFLENDDGGDFAPPAGRTLKGNTAEIETQIWRRRAYVQVAKHANDLCNLAIAIVQLSEQNSPVRRVLVHPKSWKQEGGLLSLKTEQRELVEDLVSNHKLETLAVDDSEIKQPEFRDRSSNDSDKDLSVIKFLAKLRAFDRIAYLRVPGLVMNTTSMDAIFQSDMDGHAFITVNQENAGQPSVILISPGSADAEPLHRLDLPQLRNLSTGIGPQISLASPVESIASLLASKFQSGTPALDEIDTVLGWLGYISMTGPGELPDPGEKSKIMTQEIESDETGIIIADELRKRSSKADDDDSNSENDNDNESQQDQQRKPRQMNSLARRAQDMYRRHYGLVCGKAP